MSGAVAERSNYARLWDGSKKAKLTKDDVGNEGTRRVNNRNGGEGFECAMSEMVKNKFARVEPHANDNTFSCARLRGVGNNSRLALSNIVVKLFGHMKPCESKEAPRATGLIATADIPRWLKLLIASSVPDPTKSSAIGRTLEHAIFLDGNAGLKLAKLTMSMGVSRQVKPRTATNSSNDGGFDANMKKSDHIEACTAEIKFARVMSNTSGEGFAHTGLWNNNGRPIMESSETNIRNLGHAVDLDIEEGPNHT